MSSFLPSIVITAGEPAGIGIDLCVMLAEHSIAADVTIVADSQVLTLRAAQLHRHIVIDDYDANAPQPAQPHAGNGHVKVWHHAAAEPVQAGRLDSANSAYVLNTLSSAIQACSVGRCDAMVTAPVHKGIINDAGIAFTGHTEFIAEMTHTPHVVMMLVDGSKPDGMRVALATRHLPLKDVSAAITQQDLMSTLRILHHDLVAHFGIAQPRILVAGLNPHAGEGGYLGTEEITVITPVLETLRAEGMRLIGPLPADTLFTPHNLAQGDCVLAMYHDQGLPVLKHASFGGGINVTLGLPIIRTSVDHGTALDLAGKGGADIGSLLAAIQLAIALATQASRHRLSAG